VKKPDSLTITVSCASSGGVVEVWLDSLDTGIKIAECNISNTGSWNTYNTFSTNVLQPVSGKHDIYLKFRGSGTDKLFMLQWLTFIDKNNPTSVNENETGQLPAKFNLDQNYPNPFNPTTDMEFKISKFGLVSLNIYDALGNQVTTIVNKEFQPGQYKYTWNAIDYSSGVYFYRLTAENYSITKKMLLLK
jgi:hypothetical protein